MSTPAGRGTDDDRTPLLGRAERGGGVRRENLPYWRHVLENRMTWEWYKVTLTSAAVSLLLFNLPYRNRFVDVLGAIVYLVSSVIWLVTAAIHLLRFAARLSLLHSTIFGDESHHTPVFPSSFGLLILCGATYAERLGSHNNHALRSVFWAFAVLAAVFSICADIVNFFKPCERLPAREHTSHILLPLVLSGSVAATAVAYMTPMGKYHHDALSILVVGTALHGAGILLSLMYLSNLVNTYHKSSFALGKDRPAMFIASSLASFSTTGLFQLARQAVRHFPGAPKPPLVVGGTCLYYIGITLGVAFWGLAAWWWIVSVIANLSEVDVRGTRFGGCDAVFGHVAFFLANNEILRVCGFPKALTILNEVIGVGTVVVYVAIVALGITGLSRRDFFRD